MKTIINNLYILNLSYMTRTFIPTIEYPLSSARGSQACSGEVSITVGDHVRSLRDVRRSKIFSFFYFFLKKKRKEKIRYIITIARYAHF